MLNDENTTQRLRTEKPSVPVTADFALLRYVLKPRIDHYHGLE